MPFTYPAVEVKMNDDLKLCECIAVEDDWLDISYTQRHYIEDEQDALMLVRTSVLNPDKFNEVNA